jgi:hypothetical protein
MTARLNPPVITTASLLLHHSPGHAPLLYYFSLLALADEGRE